MSPIKTLIVTYLISGAIAAPYVGGAFERYKIGITPTGRDTIVVSFDAFSKLVTLVNKDDPISQDKQREKNELKDIQAHQRIQDSNAKASEYKQRQEIADARKENDRSRTTLVDIDIGYFGGKIRGESDRFAGNYYCLDKRGGSGSCARSRVWRRDFPHEKARAVITGKVFDVAEDKGPKKVNGQILA